MPERSAAERRRPIWLLPFALLPLIATLGMWAFNLALVPIPEDQAAIEWVASLAAVASVLGFVVVGSYLAYRLPENAVGWVLAGFGFWFTVAIWVEDAVGYGLVSGATRDWAAWVGSWAWVVSGALIAVFLPLIFPDGRLLTPRWRWLPRVAVAAVGAVVVGNAFNIGSTAPVRDPVGLPALTGVLELIAGIGFVAYAVCMLAAGFSVFRRFRASQGIARRQMWLFILSIAMVMVGLASAYTFHELGQPSLGDMATGVMILFVPFAVGMAVLRYRLYDLGRLFKRTATYAALAALLLGVYFAGVLALQSVIGADDSLSVAASTLAAAALFSPARSRIQAFIDRQFDRASYDAGLVVDQFALRLRGELNLDELNLDLAKVVGSTLRPSAVSVWVRPN